MSENEERPSKSELKRRSTDLQHLGETLITLSESELEALPLPEALRDAVQLAQRITKHGGLYRQKQYIGKLMRKIDAEPIQAALDARKEQERAEARRFRRIEQWRDRLLQEGVAALPPLRNDAPNVDADVVAALIKQARKEREQDAPPRAARELFKVLRAALDP